MLSYRHSFHAGNFADVLKHIILQRILIHLCQKPAPFCCIDTHAGAGTYNLNHTYALKNKEFAQGVGRLWNREDLPPSVLTFIQTIKAFNKTADLNYYPGSPLLIQTNLRKNDRLFLFELHNTEVTHLAQTIKGDRRIKVLHADGLQDSLKLLPPLERRGLIFIDPSYEIKTDYTLVVEALKNMYQRFATGTYALWYPVVERQRNQRLEQAIKATGIKDIALFELGIAADNSHTGMTASGLIIINPPWTLMADMQVTLPWLADALSDKGQGHYRTTQLSNE